jgi:raffinose/stachyose/melibiose transport system substrate-binding protein
LVAVGALALTGCGGSSNDDATKPPGGTASGDAPALSGDLNIVISSADASDKAFNELNEAFKLANPGVDAVVTSVPNDTYDATKAAQMTAGSADIVVISFKGFRDTPQYAADSKTADVLLAEAGGYLDLTDEPFMANYNPSLIESVKISGRAYAVPTGLSYANGVFYNKQIFADNGLDIPTTWAEMEAVIATLQAASITPFGIGGKDIWPAGLTMLGIVSGLYPSGDAEQELMDGLWGGTLKLDEGKQLTVMERVETVFQAANKNFAGEGYDVQPSEFAQGKFAMLPDGTWNHTVITEAVAGAFEIGFFPMPGGDTAADNAYLNGKVELMLGVNAASKNKEAALAWLTFFSDPANYAGFVTGAGWASSQPGIAQGEFFDSIAGYTAEFRPLWEVFWIPNNDSGEAAQYPFNYPAIAPLGTQSAADAAKAAQEAWAAGF